MEDKNTNKFTIYYWFSIDCLILLWEIPQFRLYLRAIGWGSSAYFRGVGWKRRPFYDRGGIGLAHSIDFISSFSFYSKPSIKN
jgi:hypothetical protein